MVLQDCDSGEGLVAVLDNVEAGSLIQGLAFQCLDEAGRLAEASTAGKVQVSWSRGTKKVKLQNQPLGLPDIQVGCKIIAHSSRHSRPNICKLSCLAE